MQNEQGNNCLLDYHTTKERTKIQYKLSPPLSLIAANLKGGRVGMPDPVDPITSISSYLVYTGARNSRFRRFGQLAFDNLVLYTT
jgi:hypothetical protein